MQIHRRQDKMAENSESQGDTSDPRSSGSSLPPSEQLYQSSETKSGIKSETTPSKTEEGSLRDVSSECLGGLQDQNLDHSIESRIHGHRLPSGWTCDYDVDTDEYKFEFQAKEWVKTRDITSKDKGVLAKTPTMEENVQTSRCPTLNLFECQFGYHFPSSPTPSMISELAKRVQVASKTNQAPKIKQFGYGKINLTMLSDEEEQARRLRDMFPTATAPIIDQMIQIYHGREGLIKAALISLGYKRATEYDTREGTSKSPIMLMMSKPSSKKLFDKLVSYFPDRDETLLKNLMYKHKEVEHEIISVLVESGQLGDSQGIDGASSKTRLERARLNRNGVIMKLRYLKCLFPTCEEIELYHLLHCNDLNSQKVIEIVERRGHKKANIEEVIENRKSQTQQMRAQQAAQEAKEKAPTVDPLEAHKNRAKPNITEVRINSMKDNLKKSFETFEDGLILAALEGADYNESLAKKFLEEMEPIDETHYRKRYQLHRETGPEVVLFPCKGVQKNDTNFTAITFGNEYVAISREIVDCQSALALIKVDASTFTQDDIIIERFTHARGKQENLAAGSKLKNLEVKESLRRGPMREIRYGTRYDQVCSDESRRKPNDLASGRNKRLSKGAQQALRYGHNQSLIKRTHPFFVKTGNFKGAVTVNESCES